MNAKLTTLITDATASTVAASDHRTGSAQSVEHRTDNPEVAGSIPAPRTTRPIMRTHKIATRRWRRYNDSVTLSVAIRDQQGLQNPAAGFDPLAADQRRQQRQCAVSVRDRF